MTGLMTLDFKKIFGIYSSKEQLLGDLISSESPVSEEEFIDKIYLENKDPNMSIDTLNIFLKSNEDNNSILIDSVDILSGEHSKELSYCISRNGNYEFVLENSLGEQASIQLINNTLEEINDDYIITSDNHDLLISGDTIIYDNEIDGNIYSSNSYIAMVYKNGNCFTVAPGTQGKLPDNFVIPYVVSYTEVIGIGDSTGNSGILKQPYLESIEIPETVRIIEKNSFLNCTALETITIPNNVTYIGDNAFAGCTNLSFIYFKKGQNNRPIGEPWGAPNSNITIADID